ncbi:hypothetical protein [Bacteroides sp.]
MLFEGHIWGNQLKRRGISPERLMAGNENI